MTTRTKSIAVVATAIALGTVMFVFTPNEPRKPVASPEVATAREPITESAPVMPDAEAPLTSEREQTSSQMQSLVAARSPRTTRTAPSAIPASPLRPHVYCRPSRIGQEVYDEITNAVLRCQSSIPIDGREYHSDPSGEYLIEHWPIEQRLSSLRARAAMMATTTATTAELPCIRTIDFTPPVLFYPPYNRPLTHITVRIGGVDYGKREHVKLSREVWRTTVPSECDTPASLPIIIDFWPNHPQDVGSPLRIAATIQAIEVKP